MVGTTTRLFYTQDRQTERFWNDFEWNIQGVKRWPEDEPELAPDIYIGRFVIGPFPIREVEEPVKQSAWKVISDWAWGIYLRVTRSCPKFEDE